MAPFVFSWKACAFSVRRRLSSRAAENSSGHAVWPAVRLWRTTSARGKKPALNGYRITPSDV